MKGDFSRDNFDPAKHYDGVLMQQGRVQLDSDWNEQQAIRRHHEQTRTKDIIGLSGAPVHDAGFRITSPDGKSLLIGAGRYYVDGFLCENGQATIDNPGIDYAKQPDFPNAPDIFGLFTAAQQQTGIVYLEAWRQHVTALEDPSLREIALGGPDTTTRTKITWQVKILPVKPVFGSLASCGDDFPEWTSLIAGATGKMSARALPDQSTDNPCLLPPGAGYRRLENQLYRVEVHKPGGLGAASFKWSRDNGGVVTAIEKINGLELTVHDLGRDQFLGFANGQFVEVSDDATELAGLPGALIQIDHVDEATRIVVLKTAATGIDPARHAKLRRWDNAGEISLDQPAANGGWIALEDGVEVRFEAGAFATGDCWLIPARTLSGNVIWPFIAPQGAQGGRHHFARLGIVTLIGNAPDQTLNLQDCRKLFSPLAEVPPAVHIIRTSWLNDDAMSQLQLLTNGLEIFMDGSLTLPTDINNVMQVSMELSLPYRVAPLPPAAVDVVVNVRSAAQLRGVAVITPQNSLQWKPEKSGAELSVLLAFLSARQVARTRVRVSLMGNALFRDDGTTRVCLDGRTLTRAGLNVDGKPRIDLVFPSGESRRSSDFTSWFDLVLLAPPASLASLSFDPGAVNAGAAATGTVTLDHPAPAGGTRLELKTSRLDAILTVPPIVTVPEGQTTVSFEVQTKVLPGTLEVQFSAILDGVEKTAILVLEVVTVTVLPPFVNIFIGQAFGFNAAVIGTPNQNVVWGVQEEPAANITQNGVFFASQIPGVFNVIAMSVADPSKKGKAIVQVMPKQKDKEKEKEKEKEFSKDAVKEREGKRNFRDKPDDIKIHHVEAIMRNPQLLPLNPAFAADIPAIGRAFIGVQERPGVSPLPLDGHG